MKTYYLILDETLSPEIRLVDNKKWLESKNVKLIREIKRKNYKEAKEEAKRILTLNLQYD